MIERNILIALINNDKFIEKFSGLIYPELFESSLAKKIAKWCLEYYNKYGKAPHKDFEILFYEKQYEILDKESRDELKLEILPHLLNETIEEIEVLSEITQKWILQKRLESLTSKVNSLLEQGNFEEAEKLILSYDRIDKKNNVISILDVNDKNFLNKIDEVFEKPYSPLIEYPGELGKFWNNQFVREGFVSLLAPEKRGKTFWLMDIAIRAVLQGRKVLFFQAGDMSEKQQLKRILTRITKGLINPPNDFLYTWEPIKDCIKNQRNDCFYKERACDFGIFDGMDIDEIKELKLNDYIKYFEKYPNYIPCTNCDECIFTVWIKKEEVKQLTKEETKEKIEKLFIHRKKWFKMYTYPNNYLTTIEIKRVIEEIKRKEKYIPDVIVIDYADLLTTSKKLEYRHQQNEIWKDLRAISLEYKCLVVTATQSDAKSYVQDELNLSNFSEDKRKYAHVTAVYALNQDKNGRERSLGIVRISELLVREGEIKPYQVTVLQNLSLGKVYIDSYIANY